MSGYSPLAITNSRFPRRLAAVLVLAASFVMACNDDERRAAEYGCALSAIVASAGCESLVTENDVDDIFEPECGDCAEGERCHMMLDPPACRPYPLGVGETCGYYRMGEARFLCDESGGAPGQPARHCGEVSNVLYRCAAGLRCDDTWLGHCETAPAPEIETE